MAELKTMNDIELATHVLKYIDRLEQLIDLYSKYQKGDYNLSHVIYDNYKRLKSEVKDDAHYFGLVVNNKGRAKHYNDFSSAVREAAAFGFTASINSRINSKFFSAIEEARYKLEKCNPNSILEEAQTTKNNEV